VLFFDEIDAIAVARNQDKNSGVSDRVIAALLTELDGVDELSDVFVVGATNRPDIVDPALMRPGRFDKRVFLDLPSQKARLKILESKLSHLEIKGEMNKVLEATDGFSGSEVCALCSDGILSILEKQIKENSESNILEASFLVELAKKISPIATAEMMQGYLEFRKS